jgi:hypothetical protein
MKLSATQIELFDRTTRFGCPRKWWYQYAEAGPKIKPPVTGDQQLGIDVHALNEYFFTGASPGRVMSPKALTLFELGGEELKKVEADGVVGVEEKFEQVWPELGVTVKGVIDIRTKLGIVDWKTTGSIDRNSKTSNSLKLSHQMLLYGRYFFDSTENSDCHVAHVYYQTEKPHIVRRVNASFSRQENADLLELRTAPLIQQMRHATLLPVEQLEPDLTKCKYCPFSSQCPKGGSNMASIREMMAKHRVAQEAPKTEDAKMTAPQNDEQPQVVPPDAPRSPPIDAPPSNVKLTPIPEPAPTPPAALVDAQKQAPPAPITAPARPRGRPRKSEAPIKIDTVQVFELNVTELTYSEGLTLNMGDFNSVRIDSSMSAKVSGDTDLAYKELVRQVKKQLNDQAQQYEPLRPSKK